MSTFFRFFAKRHLLANLFTITILMLGLASLLKINRSQFPKGDLGRLVVTTYYPGASPEDVELNVTNKLEQELKGVTGLKNVVSASMENSSFITLQIKGDVADPQSVKDQIREAVNRVTDLPPEVTETPYIQEYKSSIFPVIEVGLASELPYGELRELARGFEKKLRVVPGVARIQRYGYRAREIQIEVAPEKLREYQISMREMIAAIQDRNMRASGGTLESYTSEKNVVTLSQFDDPMEVGDVIVRSTFTGPRIKIKDLAVVKDGFEELRIIPRLNGIRTISFVVIKSENADAIRTVDAIKELAANEQKRLGEKVQILFSEDTAKPIQNSFAILQSNGIIGLGLVLVVLALFLNLRAAFWVALGIPVTLFGVIFLLPVFKVGLDTVTLSVMVIVIGIIVDDAIIVSENIYRRFELGDSPLDAAVNGLKEVFRPVLTTILTTFLAFAPMFFMPGMLGEFLYVVPLTVSLALFISFVECVFALPAHLTRGLKTRQTRRKTALFDSLRSTFQKMISHVLRFRYVCVLVLIMGLFGAVYLASNFLQVILFPTKGANSFQIRVELPVGTSLQATSDKVRELEGLLETLPEDEVESYGTRIGANKLLINDIEGEHLATLSVNLSPYSERTRTADEIIEALRAESANLEGYKNLVYEVVSGGPRVGKAVTLRIVGSHDEVRSAFADSISSYLKAVPGVKDIDRNDKLGKEQIQIRIDYDKLASLGLTVAAIAQNVRIAYDGQVVTSVRYGDEDVDFRVILAADARKRLTYLRSLSIPKQQGRLIPLKEVAYLKTGPGKSTIHHYDGERATTVTADVDQEVTTAVKAMAAVTSHFDADQVFPGMALLAGGESQETRAAIADLGLMFVFAIVGIYFLLMLLFDSVFQPILVLAAIPFGVIGVIIAFAVHGEALGFLALWGIVGLTGVVVNDSLVLVNHLNELRRQRKDAPILSLIAEGTSDRLRAILLTTISTVMGLLPLAYGLGGTDVYMAPMALALGYGLLFATPLTIVGIPCLYMIGADISKLLSYAKTRKI
ncbi:MAG: efflux RND transporter permease subunit [Gammaproteobacteria bacterium]|nr:efflux RND transporter permease subunit [Gammaproteobacteria bacterium]